MLVVMMRLIHPRLKNSPFEALIVSYSTYRWRKMALVLNKLDNLLLKKLPILLWSGIKREGGKPFCQGKRVIAFLLAPTGALVVIICHYRSATF